MSSSSYDVVVIGGGSAGLAAAVTLGRSLRSVAVVDAGKPRNAPSPSAHNVLGREGVRPLDLLAAGRREAEGVGAEILRDTAVTADRADDGRFRVRLAGGRSVLGRRLVLATGLTDVLPDVPGVRELWGRDVLHCPYCHGYEVRGRRIGILAVGPRSVHQALLFRQLSPHVTFFLHGDADLPGEDRARLDALEVPVVAGRVLRLRADGGRLEAVVLEDGTEIHVEAVAVAPRFMANADLYRQLGGTVTDHPLGAVVSTGPAGVTDVPGVWAAGNLTDLAAMVATAAGSGVVTGAAVNADLVMADAAAAAAAVAAARLSLPGAVGEAPRRRPVTSP